MAKTINLTTRKKSLPERVLGTFIKETVGDKIIYTVRFSQVYQPKGHEWNPSFKVLRGGYWLRHRILTEQDVSTYETLQFLAADDKPFTVEGLAAACGKSKNTLRRIFDNLINAELLEIVTVADGQGKPNYYILRTPLYERETFTDSTKKRILAHKETLPVTFLEDEAERLRLQITKNRIGKLRRLELRRRKAKKEQKDLTGASLTLYENLVDRYSNQNFVLHRVFKTLGEKLPTPDGEPQRWDYNKAVEFDRIVWYETRSMPDTGGTTYWDELKRRIKKAIAKTNIKYTVWLCDLAAELSALYDTRQRKQGGSSSSGAKRANISPAPIAENFSDDYEMSDETAREASVAAIKKTFAEKRSRNDLPRDSREFRRVLDNIGAEIYLSFEEIKTLVAEYFPNDLRQKVLVEKLE